MIPFVMDYKELDFIKKNIIGDIEALFEKYKAKVDYKIGTMIEIPRACLLADEIAKLLISSHLELMT